MGSVLAAREAPARAMSTLPMPTPDLHQRPSGRTVTRMRTRRRMPQLTFGFSCVLLLLASCVRETPDDGKIHLQYWEKWVRFEGEAMQRVVDAFNSSQDRIVVHMQAFG